MRYVQLRAFHNVAIHGGFSRAAEALSLTQPAVSDQVRKLESEYDVLLFSRQKKQITLTDFGKKLLEITHRMFDVEDQAHVLLSESRALGSAQETRPRSLISFVVMRRTSVYLAKSPSPENLRLSN